MSEIYDKLREAVVDGDEELVEELVQEVLDNNVDPVAALENGLIKGIEEVGALWKLNEVFLPDVMMAADAMKTGMEMLSSAIAATGQGDSRGKGRIVIGTVKGDIHDIGKNIVSAMLTAFGFKVYDIGVDQPAEAFLAKAREIDADVVGLSALLTTTMHEQQEIIKFFGAEGARDDFKLVIGGGPTTKAWSEEIGADGYAETADEAVDLCKSLIN
jgi:trimethylamine corrinoid protein